MGKIKDYREREFKNENFHIKVWETMYTIGAETIFVKRNYMYNSGEETKDLYHDISINEHSLTQFYGGDVFPYFGMRGGEFVIDKDEILYSFDDLCKALERAEQETCEEKLVFKDLIQELIDISNKFSKYFDNLIKEG